MAERETVALCRGVTKLYPTSSGDVEALREVDVNVSSGGLTAIVGPSGSGKSSLLRILAALDRPTHGSVEVGEEWVSEMNARRRRRFRRHYLRYVFQRPSDNLISYLSVAEHMALALQVSGVSGAGRSDEVLELLGLAHRSANKPHELSGGEQQRVAFAQAVVSGPLLVIADEPTAELDAHSTLGMVALMTELTERGTTLLVSTHDPDVIAAATVVVRLERGRRVS